MEMTLMNSLSECPHKCLSYSIQNSYIYLKRKLKLHFYMGTPLSYNNGKMHPGVGTRLFLEHQGYTQPVCIDPFMTIVHKIC